MPQKQKQTEKRKLFSVAEVPIVCAGLAPASDYIKSSVKMIFSGGRTRFSTSEKSVKLKDFEKLLECKKFLFLTNLCEELLLHFICCLFEIHNIHPFCFVVALLYTIPQKSQVILHKYHTCYLCTIHKFNFGVNYSAFTD